MSKRVINGAELLCRTLASLGVTHVFGVPGTQNVLLYEALHRCGIRSILATNELCASFMANGYHRASGRVAPLLTIPGPGFTYALTGLAEALHDSTAVLHIVGQPAAGTSTKYGFQALDQNRIATPLVKCILSISQVEEIPRMVTEAHDISLTGEPGPVLLQWSKEALSGFSPRIPDYPRPDPSVKTISCESLLKEASEFIGAARRPILLVGQGAAGSAESIRQLAESIVSPVFTTASGRGVLPEDHALALGFDFNRSNVKVLNDMIGISDCIVVIGCKLSHAGTGGFQLELPTDRLIRVDASAEVLEANYPARLPIIGSVEAFLDRLLPAIGHLPRHALDGWHREEIEEWKKRLRIVQNLAIPEPVIHGVTPPTAESFFKVLRRILPRDGIVVTDSGLHQVLVRRHLDILTPRGLIAPSDFQSMGYGLPAAIGAKIANPERPVVAVLGDGGFAMSGMEILTAVREKIPITAIVFNDSRLNLIRIQQFEAFGGSESVDILNPDFSAFAPAMGARYALINGNAEEVLQNAIGSTEVNFIEVAVGDSPAIHRLRMHGLIRNTTRRVVGPGIVRWLKRCLGKD